VTRDHASPQWESLDGRWTTPFGSLQFRCRNLRTSSLDVNFWVGHYFLYLFSVPGNFHTPFPKCQSDYISLGALVDSWPFRRSCSTLRVLVDRHCIGQMLLTSTAAVSAFFHFTLEGTLEEIRILTVNQKIVAWSA